MENSQCHSNLQKGQEEDPWNFRPVSLNSIPGKVMEQLIPEIIKQVEEKKFIRSSQNGFTKANRS